MRPFATTKFRSFLLAGTFTAFVGYVSWLADSVIIGRLIGEDALAGLNMVAPILSAVSFFASVIAFGASTNYSIWMGRIDCRRAREFCMQGLWLSLLIGGALTLAIRFGGDSYVSALNGSEYVEMYARQYLEWAWPIGLMTCLIVFLAVFCCVDGDIRLCAVVYVGVFVVDVAVSYAAVRFGMGASGCSFGTVVAEAVGILSLCGHFLRKTNTFRPVRHFSFVDSYYVFRSSFGDAAAFLCEAVLFFVLNKLVIEKFGSDLLPVAGVAIVMWSFTEISAGIGMAVQPLVAVYWGERNTKAIRRVMRTAIVAAIVEGLVLSALAVVGRGGLVMELLGVEGLDYPELLVAVRNCVLLMCGGFAPLALANLLNSYFLFIERPWISLGTTVLCYLLMPVACVLAGSFFGFEGVWAGLGAGPLLGILTLAVLILMKRGRQGFPLLLPRGREAKIWMFDLELTEPDIVRVSKEVAKALPESVAQRAALMVEEVYLTVRERNPKRRKVIGEVTLDLNDGILMTLRDDGVIFDITDADARVSSLRTYLVASVMERHHDRINLVTSGFNRNVFRFA